jgi:dinuclear metal center YbgI/SA1388 family protein
MSGENFMSVNLRDLVAKLDEILQPDRFKDYCPNGLQVEGRSQVGKIVSGVTASRALLGAAVAERADAVLVHHGYFWRGENPCLVGIKRHRVALLMQHDISLLAYHLPLDEHPLLGNNAQLARRLAIPIVGEPGRGDGSFPVMEGALDAPVSGDEISARIARALGRKPLHIAAERRISRLAWCTGGGQGFIEQAIELGVDAYISGEVSEQTVHVARENGVHFFAAGHHATERYGVQALGEHLARELPIEHRFIDIDNPA